MLKFQPLRVIEFITGHMVYNLAYNYLNLTHDRDQGWFLFQVILMLYQGMMLVYQIMLKGMVIRVVQFSNFIKLERSIYPKEIVEF